MMKKLSSIILIVIIITPVNGQTLDLKEANVTAVEFNHIQNNDYEFSVTLYHDDDGESPNYADLWVVEDFNGTELGRRVLTHSHGTLEFTRSATITIPNYAFRVVVRGHDQLHGWGGQAAIVDMNTSEVAFVRQGADKLDFTNTTQSPNLTSGQNLSPYYWSSISIVFLFGIFRRRQVFT